MRTTVLALTAAFTILCSFSSGAENRAVSLAEHLPPSALKTALTSCAADPLARNDFSISHRGAPLGYPEHTAQGYRAAAAMGAGLIECDVTFTKDKVLVCRHSQCDLHRTTNILTTPLASRCSTPFSPASGDQPAAAKCCTSDITVAEFKNLCGRPDHVNPRASTVEEYFTAQPSPVAAQVLECGTVLTHRESIELIHELGRDFVPELKSPMVAMPFDGFTQTDYAAMLLAEYRAMGVPLTRVYPQSFDYGDITFWLEQYPEVRERVIFLDPRGRQADFSPSPENMQALYDQGLRILAPPIPMLLELDDDGRVVPTSYARFARQANLDLITWTFERGNILDPGNFMWARLQPALAREADMLVVLQVLDRSVGVRGVFSDWPETTSTYANCRVD